MRLLGLLGRRGLPGADRPDRLVGDHEVLVRLEHGDLAAQHLLRLPGLALGLGLADAGDDESPASSPAAARFCTPSSVSPKSWRRSEWPTIAP